jgi:hypothetical protein
VALTQIKRAGAAAAKPIALSAPAIERARPRGKLQNAFGIRRAMLAVSQ